MISGDPELLSNDLVEFNADDRTEVGYSITPPEVPKPETAKKVAPRNVMTREEPAQYRIVKHPPGGASSSRCIL